MENGSESYKCEKCGNTLLKTNKLLHDLKCNTNKNINIINPPNFIDINEISTVPIKNGLYDVYENDNEFFECNKCKMVIDMKDKVDHLLCHQLEQGESIKVDNGNNLFISDSLNNEIMDNNTINNINQISINNNIDSNINNINTNFINLNINNNIEINDSIDHGSELNEELNSVNEDEEFDENDDDDFDIYDNGLDENMIKTYPVSKIKDISKLTEEKKKCCICLENYKNNDETIILPCVHIFHSNCIKHWMKRQDNCPICKNKII